MQDCTAQHPGFLQIYSKAGMQCLEQGAERRVPGIARDSRHAPKLCKISEIGEVMGKNVSCKHGPAQADVISDLMPFMSPRPNQTLYICWLSDKKINIYKKKITPKMCSFTSQFRKRRATVSSPGFAPQLNKPEVTEPPTTREQNNSEHF